MDHSHDGFSASNSPKPSATTKPSISGETDENHIEQDQMNSKSQKSRKHSMSPTISATTKATVPRKKILAEKNESLTSFDIHPQRSPKLHPGTFKCDRSSSRAISTYNCTSESDVDGHNTRFADSSLKPYDPLTNYLSPRPKYLRYKPNRRREIFDGQEPQEEKGDVSFLQRAISFDSQKLVGKKSSQCGSDSLACLPQEGSSRLENQEIVKAEDDGVCGVNDDNEEKEEEEEEEEEEEIEEFEEDKGWSLKGVLKFLVLLIVVSLSTSYISSMNTPTPSLIQQAVWGVRDGCYRIQKHLYEAMSTNLNIGTREMECGTQTSEAQTDFLEVNKLEVGSLQMVVGDEDELVESRDDILKIIRPRNWQDEYISRHGFDKRDELLDHLFDSQTTGIKNADSVQVEFKEGDFDWPEKKITESKVLKGEMDMIGEGSDQVPRLESDESTEQVLKTVEQGFQELEVRESLEKVESFGGFNKPLHSQRMDDHHIVFDIGSTYGNEKPADSIDEVGIFRKKEGEEMVGKGLERTVEIMRTMEDETLDRDEIVEGISVKKTEDEIVEAKWSGHDSAREDSLARLGIENPSAAESRFETKEEPMKAIYVEFGLLSTSWIGFSIFAIVVSFFVYIFFPRAIQAPTENSQPVTVPSEESERKEKSILVHRPTEVKKLETKVESTVNSSSMIFSTGEMKERSDIQAPEVELLGELVIGKVSSSFKSCSRISKMTETEESMKAISHVESRAYSVAPPEPSVLDTASTDSPSYGSFTAEKKILKKEGPRDGDVKIIITPVRRSSRVRNRTVTSP